MGPMYIETPNIKNLMFHLGKENSRFLKEKIFSATYRWIKSPRLFFSECLCFYKTSLLPLHFLVQIFIAFIKQI